MLRKPELGWDNRKILDGGMAGSVPLGFVCAAESEDVEAAGIRWGQPEEVGLDGGMAGAVPLAFACAGVSGDVEEAGIRWGATAEGGGEGV